MPTGKAVQVNRLFARIVPRYDLMNRLMTFGRDQSWRRTAACELQLPLTGLCLDLATGTGDLALAVRWLYPSAQVVGVDFTVEMIQAARAKADVQGDPHLIFILADALALPFAAGQFDGLVNGFLLRNLVDLPLALGEMRRVLKPGGRVVCLEITHTTLPLFRQLFHLYFYAIVPLIGGLIARDFRAYAYLPRSLTVFPPAPVLQRLMEAAGFHQVSFRLLGFGAVAVHSGVA